MSKILIVEDDPGIADFENLELKHEGFETVVAVNGREALEKFKSESPDLILLDLMIPEVSGLEVTREIRRSSHVPIIMVTARGETYDKIIGLDSGADDYISKPFDIEELLARMRSVLRRSGPAKTVQASKLTNRSLEMTPDSMKTVLNGKELTLSKTEFLILKYFLENQKKVLSRTQIIEAVWGKGYSMDENTIDVYVGYLRAKIDQPSKTEFIKTVRGKGYMMVDGE